jgi:hypothetical protein
MTIALKLKNANDRPLMDFDGERPKVGPHGLAISIRGFVSLAEGDIKLVHMIGQRNLTIINKLAWSGRIGRSVKLCSLC